MTWAAKRQLKYLSVFLGFFLLILFWILYPIIFKKPTCFDGKKNGDEIEIDCGGSCAKFCNSQIVNPIIVWSRAFPVTNNVYNLAAYVQNQNRNAAVLEVNYEFRVYDDNNRLIGRREGSAFIPPNQQFLVFEPRFDSGETKVKSVTFQFLPSFSWYKKEPLVNLLPFRIDNISLNNDFNLPTLTARIRNESIYELPPFEVVGILYDIDNNAINISKTQKDFLMSGSESSISFTWPGPLIGNPVRNEIFIQVNPFSLNF